MARLFGKDYKREELLRYSGNLSNFAGVTRIEYAEGKKKGVAAFEVKTGTGLEFTLLEDKCLDIFSLTYKGVTISQQAKNGLTAPALGVPAPGAFGATVSGGMLFTSGLRNSGPESVDNGEFHPVHGRIGVAPAEGVSASAAWRGDEYEIAVSGTMRESALFGHNLTLTRKVETALGKNELLLTDTLENNAPEEEEICLLYHFNFGFPFLSEALDLRFPEGEIIPRTPEAEAGLPQADKISPPEDGFFEHVFIRRPRAGEDGWVTFAAENRELGVGASISYEKENLPLLMQWKSMRSGDYALGIEPANMYIMGRAAERENGTLPKLAGFSKLTYRLKLSVYDLD